MHEQFEQAGLVERVGPERFYPTVRAAVEWISGQERVSLARRAGSSHRRRSEAWSESFASWSRSRWRRSSPAARRRPQTTAGRCEGGRHLSRRLREQLQLHGRLRPDRRVPDLLVGDRVEPARAHAARLRPRRRPGRQQARARHRHLGAGAHRRRQDLHLPPEARGEVRPAGRPRGHVEGRALRVRAHGEPDERRAVRLLLLGDRGLRRVRRRQGEDDLGDRRRRTRTRSSSTSRARAATSPTASPCRRRGRSRSRSRSASRARPRSTAATRSRPGRT